MQTALSRSQKIAELNDEFRKKQSYMFTKGVLALPYAAEVADMVRNFNDFNPDNDPYGEHDFGQFFFNEKIMWKIDYYNPDLLVWCDPLDAACRRVLTVMLAEEY